MSHGLVGGVRPLRVRVLGNFEIEGVERLGFRKARTLLKVLVLARGRWVSVDHLADCLWGMNLPRVVNREVSVLVSRARAVLGADRVPHSSAGYCFQPDWLDLAVASDLAKEAVHFLEVREYASAWRTASAALVLFRGQLLTDEKGAEWVEAHRVAAARLASGLRHAGARAALVLGNFDDAVEMAERALDYDSFDEVALQMSLAARAAAGRPASAVARYAQFRALVRDELGTSPTPQTDAVHLAILKGEPIRDTIVKLATARAASSSHLVILDRQQEALNALDTAFARVVGGERHLVVVEGGARAGKSRLLGEWLAGPAVVEATVLTARGRTTGRAQPLCLLRQAVDDHLRRMGPGAFELFNSLPEVATPVPVSRAGGTSTIARSDGRENLAPTEALIYRALLSVIERIAGERPVVLALDDVHLGDPESLDWIDFVIRSAPQLRLLTVVTQPPGRRRLPSSAETIRLGESEDDDDRASSAYVSVRSFHRDANGDRPLHAELVTEQDDPELPPTVVRSLDRRLAEAGAAGITIRVAAILGPELQLEPLSSVLGLGFAELLDHLALGVRQGFLDEHGPTLAFRHRLVREALISSTPVAWRNFIATRVARMPATPFQGQ